MDASTSRSIRFRLSLLVLGSLVPGMLLTLYGGLSPCTGGPAGAAVSGSGRLLLAGLALMVGGATATVWAACAGWVCRPAHRLIQAVGTARGGDFGPLDEIGRGKDEFARLAQAIMPAPTQDRQSTHEPATGPASPLLKSFQERVKELSALYETSHLLLEERPAREILRSVVEVIPRAWQYPDVAAARILLDGDEYTTTNYTPVPWRQRADFQTADGQHGCIEVAYLQNRPEEQEGPFLTEERHLLTSLSLMLKSFLDRTSARGRLRESEERFRNAFENAPIGMGLIAPDGRWTMVNRALCDIVGYTEADLTGTAAAALRLPDDARIDHVLREELLAHKRSAYQSELRYLHRKGHTIWVHLTGSLVTGPDGAPAYTIVQIQDITERRLSEQRLNQTLERLNSLLDISREITSNLEPSVLLPSLLTRVIDSIGPADIGVIFVLDRQTGSLVPGAAIGYDAQALRQIRLAPGEGISGAAFAQGSPLIGRTGEDAAAFHATLTPINEALFAQARHGLRIRSSVSAPLRTPDQEVTGAITLASTQGAFSDDDLALLEAIAGQTAVAIQNAKLFEETREGRERLRALSHRLVEAQEAERRGIAHELHDEIGQTLTLARLNLQALERHPATTPIRDDIRECATNVENSLQQVRDISVSLRPSTLDDLGLVAAIRWLVYRSAKQGGLVAHIEDRIGDDISIPSAVETTCYRVVQEAITNTIRHARAQNVYVSVACEGPEIRVTIRDDGIGFDVDEMLNRASAGHSLGLLGMQERVLLVQGRFSALARPGSGTEIRAWLPLSQGPAGPQEKQRRKP